MQLAINPATSIDWILSSRFAGGGQLGILEKDAVNTPPATIDEAQLLQRIAQRDRQAFSQLYDRYAGVLYSTTIRILKDSHEANDVLQEVFLQIWDKAGRYDPALGKPFNWALTLTRNKAIDRMRSLKRGYSFIEEVAQEMELEAHDFSAPPDEVFSQEQAAMVRAAVTTLPLEQRQAIEMAFLGGMTQNEIAAALTQPLGTIKARIRRGMLKLRDSLKHIA
jgi:RNA polymerase sigma-70 factor (ECF subfamily)